MEYLPAVEMEFPDGAEITASVIWLHGLGADGNDFAPIVPQLGLSESTGVRFIFPHAPSIPVTINNGFVMPAWYDIKQLDVDRHVDEAQLRQSAQWVHDLIERELTAASIEIQPVQNTIPILICHGKFDPVVPEALGRKSVATLQNLGFNPEYESYPMEHAVCPQQIADIGTIPGA